MRRFLILSMIFVLPACGMLEAADRRVIAEKLGNCSYERAYQDGYEDAKAGNKMDASRVTKVCNDLTKDEAAQGYADGYGAWDSNARG